MSLCVSAALLAGCATSGPPGAASTVEGAFIRAAPTWDLNRDGVVTCDEWKNYAASLFKEVDEKRDGKLTPDEFAKLQNKDHLFDIADMKYFDTAGKGYVTLADIVDRPNPAFLILDKQKTCRLETHILRAAVVENDPLSNDVFKRSRDR